MNLSNDYYFKKYGIDISCEISSIFEVCDDNDRINAVKMILDNLEQWWKTCINNEQEEKEYNKLLEILEKVKELEEIRRYNFKEFMYLNKEERKKYIHSPYAYSFNVETSDMEFVVISDTFNAAIEAYNTIVNGRKYKNISANIKTHYTDDKEV